MLKKMLLGFAVLVTTSGLFRIRREGLTYDAICVLVILERH